jgi:outer membrane protein OmpA-like peptidoglycan-associated protein
VTKISVLRCIAVVLLIGGLATAPQLNFDATLDTSNKPALPTPTPRFDFRWQRGTLRLAGHTTSANHEQSLLQIATSSFSEHSLETDFMPLGIVPDQWEDLSVQVLYLLAESISSEAVLSSNKIDIRGVTIKEVAWKSRLEALRKVLPEGVSVSANMLYIDPTIDAKQSCSRAAKAFAAGAIKFAESSAEFLNSAYPRLDRVVALAGVCTATTISITGHTDSSGSEEWNQRLSLKRAAAVSDYIAHGGIEKDRLLISSASSSLPIADNETRYGRSLNRRIDIKLQTDQQAN